MVGADDPVAKGGAVLVACILEDADAGAVVGCNVGIELVEGGVLEAELSERLYDDGAEALVAVFGRDDDAHGGAAVDGVIVIKLDATHRRVGHVVGIGVELEFARGERVTG